MTSHRDIIQRWAQQVGKPDARFLKGSNARVMVSPLDRRNLCSYGTHFVLARLMPDAEGETRGWFLLNGDTWSVSTSRHQHDTRTECAATGLPVMILPFSVLQTARIDIDTIEPVDVTEDRWDVTTHRAATLDEVPAHQRMLATDTGAGWTWETRTHRLGAALFRAHYSTSIWIDGDPVRTNQTALFLSAFDEQEDRHYFMAELPQDTKPDTVHDAFLALRPEAVLDADDAGVAVTRQGDVFAVPTTLTTRQIHKLGTVVKRGILLGLSHEASQVVAGPDGTTYARGLLYHAPRGADREPEHRRQRMGDGRTWHIVMKNTVPLDARNDSRAWSRAAQVD